MSDSWVWYHEPPDCVVEGCTETPAFEVDDGEVLCLKHWTDWGTDEPVRDGLSPVGVVAYAVVVVAACILAGLLLGLLLRAAGV